MRVEKQQADVLYVSAFVQRPVIEQLRPFWRLFDSN
jgi:hypothetical protein